MASQKEVWRGLLLWGSAVWRSSDTETLFDLFQKFAAD